MEEEQPELAHIPERVGDLVATAAVVQHPTQEPPPRPRRRVAWMLLVALAIAGAVAAQRWWARAAPLALTVGDRPAVLLDPLRTEASSPDEEVAPFAGFAVAVQTKPPGAIVRVQGVERGEAPVLADVPCSASQRVRVEARWPDDRTATVLTTCREDALVKLTLRRR